MPEIIRYTQDKFIKFLDNEEKFQAIEGLAGLFTDSGVCSDIKSLIHALKDRERIMSTGIGFGIAIPHAKIKPVKKIAFALGISKKGIDFDSMDGKPVNIVILIAAGENQHKDYLGLMSSIMTVLKDETTKEAIINSSSKAEVLEILSSKE